MTTTITTTLKGWVAAVLCAALAGCGGGGSGGANPPAGTAVGSSGGSVEGAAGAEGLRLDVPADALATTTTLTVTRSDDGAPPLPALPAGMTLGPTVYALTPHGTAFSRVVTLSLPRGDVPAGARVWLLKTNEDRSGWQQIEARVVGERIVAPITGFSNISYAYCNSCRISAPPVVSTPPRSGTVQEGGYVLLSVDAIGDAPLRYQWFRGNFLMPGETGRAVVVNPVALSDDGMQLTVEVTDAQGRSVRSAAAVATVRAIAPKVVSDPADAQARDGGMATFAAGTVSGLPQTLRWQRSADGVNWADVPGGVGSAARLVLAPVTAADDGAQFRLNAANGVGSVTTRAARLTVLPALQPPALVAYTASVARPVGRSASFVTEFSGAELKYAWERSDDAGTTWQPVAGADAATLTIAAVTLADDGARFRATARNDAGNASTPAAVLTVSAQAGGLVDRLAGGRAHSLGLHNDGRLFGWGGNAASQMARAAGGPLLAPQLLGGLNNVAAFAAGGDANLVLLDSGVLHAWGDNTLGQALYFDRATTVTTPQPVFGTSVTARAVAIGPGTALAMGLSLPAQTLTWGTGFYGDGQRATARDEVSVPRLVDPALVRAAPGPAHSLGITGTGAVVAWGENVYGQLGLGHRGAALTATPVPTLTGIVSVAVGTRHSLALGLDGLLWAWGANDVGQLGGATTLPALDVPVRVPMATAVVAIASGREHALALLADGRLFAWGRSDRGQVGHGFAGNSEVTAPREITAAWTRPLRAVAAGDRHSLVLDAAGVVWAWGANDQGQLGDGTQTDRAVPVAAPALNLGALR